MLKLPKYCSDSEKHWNGESFFYRYIIRLPETKYFSHPIAISQKKLNTFQTYEKQNAAAAPDAINVNALA
jgi:hypothetical protein